MLVGAARFERERDRRVFMTGLEARRETPGRPVAEI
jgi:hypothetical protein